MSDFSELHNNSATTTFWRSFIQVLKTLLRSLWIMQQSLQNKQPKRETRTNTHSD